MIGRALLFWLLALLTVAGLTALWTWLMWFIVQVSGDRTAGAIIVGDSIGLIVPIGASVLIMATFYDLLSGGKKT